MSPRRGERAMVPDAQFQSYYGLPIINPPVWAPTIALYFFTGGLAAGSSALAVGADLSGNSQLRRVTRYIAFGALIPSMFFLIEDLGKPTRFINMLRVFKPTSPMSMGSWLLSAYGPAAAAAAASEAGILPAPLGDAAGAAAAVAAPALATYTAVLISDTAVPVWHESRHELPFLYAAGAAASAGAVAMTLLDPRPAAPARRMAVGGAVAELVISQVEQQRLGDLADVYRTGRAGVLDKVSTACTLTGAIVAAVAGRRRRGAVVGGALIAVGALAKRLATFEAGMASAKDPAHTVRTQRSGLS